MNLKFNNYSQPALSFLALFKEFKTEERKAEFTFSPSLIGRRTIAIEWGQLKLNII